MFGKVLEKALDAGVEFASEKAVKSACEYSSVTVTSDYLNGPRNILPPLLPFLPANKTGKWLAAGMALIGSVCLWATRGFVPAVAWYGLTYGLYAVLYGGTVLQSPPALGVPKVYHFLGWKARLIGLLFLAACGMLLCS